MIGAHFLAMLAALAPVTAGDVPWESSYELASDRAVEENKVIFIAINMDGEAANDRLANRVYRADSIAELAARTVNVVGSRFNHRSGNKPCKRFGTVTCGDHRLVEREVRGTVVMPDKNGRVIAPQHFFLMPDGEVILSVTYEITRSELEWCFVTAMLKLDPECGVVMPEGARVPRRLNMRGAAEVAVTVRPLSKDELEKALKAMRSGFGALTEASAFRQLLVTDDPKAVAYISKELKSGYLAMVPDLQQSTLRTIGATSPASFWKAVSPFLDPKYGQSLRNEAAVALEQLDAPKSVRALKSALSKAKYVDMKKNVLRALGSAGAEDKGARKLILRYVKDKNSILRRNALLALAWHTGDKKVDGALLAALEAEDPMERRAAALALAVGRRTEYRDELERAMKARRSSGDAEVMQRALLVLDGENLATIRADVARVCNDRFPRTRFFGGPRD